MLLPETKSISPKKFLHVIDVEVIEGDLRILLDKHFVSICEGDSTSELQLVKKRLLKFLQTKNEGTQMGAVAEFFVHLFLNQENYKQEFLLLNLEENSIKKGFDGVFTKDSEIYLVESKSGSILSKEISHKAKLKTAFSDITKYVSGQSEKGNNNPWRNAYNHASHCDVRSKRNIRDKIRDLRDMYDNEIYTKVEDYNVIPCSTIFLNSVWDNDKNLEILNDCDFIDEFDALSIIAICITKTSLNNFFQYLES
ncbi:hypothetical protein [Vibrio campbellii]|uniref:hypothetical protein n=1 Tax=Vibrio campbellii TaxID=680 RepID=UPI003F827394